LIEVVEKIKNKIKALSLDIGGEHIGTTDAEIQKYIDGLSDALKILEDSVIDMLVVNCSYYVIMYHNGDKNMPYIQKMILYKVSQSKKRRSYCFCEIKDGKQTNIPALVLASSPGVFNRVFLTKEKAERKIGVID